VGLLGLLGLLAAGAAGGRRAALDAICTHALGTKRCDVDIVHNARQCSSESCINPQVMIMIHQERRLPGMRQVSCESLRDGTALIALVAKGAVG
jgi:hypothetical protein